ncbi:MAG: hypothetical protein DNFNHJIP_00009 [Candidatus Argoarchaeum ethanivorans]|uniref:NodB homology domain-containing protein n=1 Tax=Candidatus Argoarchaeum ethanivorans TaxID=2608793 RepID=A0A811ZZP6_9EURY|nr:MAG: hypothetical protein DNFNHJIP_00009 [Candidatus Argoarchaeum ethanivorans]
MKTIGIHTTFLSEGHRRLFDALGELFNVYFEKRLFGDGKEVDCWLFINAGQVDLDRIAQSNRTCFTVISENELVACGESPVISFSKHLSIDSKIRGRQIKTNEAIRVKSLPQWIQNGTMIASKEDAPIWMVLKKYGYNHHYVSTPIPELNDEGHLFQYFQGKQFLQLLPLLLFLRALTEDQRWEPPPLQACFMIDDPNLHWPTYGYINFRKMAEHARIHNYHMSFATVPIDSWFVHKPTAALFRQYHDQLSLLMHGNDHITHELFRPYSNKERNRFLRQSLERIERLERLSGVEVSRVNAPPHGKCSPSVIREMAEVGFEAACIPRGALRRLDGQQAQFHILGMRPVDTIEGLTVFSRFPLSGSCHNNILLAALLDQPIIPVGHHQDVAEGLQVLGELSKFINSLGSVNWVDMKRISRSHFAQKIDGRILHLRMLTKHIEFFIPDGITQICIERPWLEDRVSESLAWRISGESKKWKPQIEIDPITVLPGQRIEIVSNVTRHFVIYSKNNSRISIWPMVRRLLAEGRDRVAPVFRWNFEKDSQR